MTPKTLTVSAVRRLIPARPRDAHKGTSGHLLIVAGSRGMSGASVLSTLGALHGGAGLVTTALPETERLVLTGHVPEALSLPLPTSDGKLSPAALSALNRYRKNRPLTALALGPGLSMGPAIRTIVRHLLITWPIPSVLDADGINVLTPEDFVPHPALVLTPHPGEMARFLGLSRKRVLDDGPSLVARWARQLGVVFVLKSHRTLVSDGHHTFVNTTGNAAMATGGMGDVLTGLIGALLAQGLRPLEAACAGVFVHGLAGDLVRVGDRGLLARELAKGIPSAFKKIGVSRGSH